MFCTNLITYVLKMTKLSMFDPFRQILKSRLSSASSKTWCNIYTCTAFFCPLETQSSKIPMISMVIRGSWVIGLKVIPAKNLQKTTFSSCIPRWSRLCPHHQTWNDRSWLAFQLFAFKSPQFHSLIPMV